MPKILKYSQNCRLWYPACLIAIVRSFAHGHSPFPALLVSVHVCFITRRIPMTERLYYTDSFVQEFEGRVVSLRSTSSGTVLLLDRSAFYPTSGGQIFDTGWLDVVAANGSALRVRVVNVEEDESTGEVLHYVEGLAPVEPGTAVRGAIDLE